MTSTGQDGKASNFNFGGGLLRPLYPHPLERKFESGAPFTHVEQCVRNFIWEFRNRLDWTEKILDHSFFVEQLKKAQEKDQISYSFKILIWEGCEILRAYMLLVDVYKPYVEKLRENGSFMEPDIPCVWREDGFMSEQSRKDLIAAVETLESVPEEQKKTYEHPNSNGQVLNLVDPALRPVVYGETNDRRTKEPIARPDYDEVTDYDSGDDSDDEEYYSKGYCFLPSEFEVSADGESTKIASYVNGLSSPDQKALFYPILEKVFTKLVPLFNNVLNEVMSSSARLFFPPHQNSDFEPYRIGWLTKKTHNELWRDLLRQFEAGEDLEVDFWDHLEPEPNKENGGKDDPEMKDDDNKESSNENDDLSGYPGTDENGDEPFLCIDMVKDLIPWDWRPPKTELKRRLDGSTVKVIVKIMNVILTQEEPTYQDTAWQIDGLLNERIIATGIYCYDKENIGDLELIFGHRLRHLEHMCQNVDDNFEIVHNMPGKVGHPSFRAFGSTIVKDNRAIVFPNVFHHRFGPFELVDKTTPGHCKFLVFSVCDPHPENEITTTKNVTPSHPEYQGQIIEALLEGPLGKFPAEIFQSIAQEVTNGLPVKSKEEAEEDRRRLIAERLRFYKMHVSRKITLERYREHKIGRRRRMYPAWTDLYKRCSITSDKPGVQNK
ncbi:hypothetical protein ABW20_dc0103337 [Dactylellina cionopaga]|nr:hypothetical protein ABW20_dc0103337 [Dactylellina cionopaga]